MYLYITFIVGLLFVMFQKSIVVNVWSLLTTYSIYYNFNRTGLLLNQLQMDLAFKVTRTLSFADTLICIVEQISMFDINEYKKSFLNWISWFKLHKSHIVMCCNKYVMSNTQSLYLPYVLPYIYQLFGW